MIADKAIGESDIGSDNAVPAEHDARAKHRVGADAAIFSDLRIGADDRARRNAAAFTDGGSVVNQGRACGKVLATRRRIKSSGDTGISAIGFFAEQQSHAAGRFAGMVGVDQTGSGAAFAELIDISLIV